MEVALVPFAFYDPSAAALRALGKAAIALVIDGGRLSIHDRGSLLECLRLLQGFE